MSKLALNPDVLRWARTTAGLDVDEAAKKLGFKDGVQATAREKFEAIETGEKPVSSALLHKMTEVYRRNLITFFVAEPPTRGERGQDFRLLPEDRLHENEATVDALIRSIRARQAIVRAVIEDEEDREPLDFIGQAKVNDPIRKTAQSIVERLDFDRNQFCGGNVSQSFAYLRKQVEELGVFVLLMGNLGTHHTNITSSAANPISG